MQRSSLKIFVFLILLSFLSISTFSCTGDSQGTLKIPLLVVVDSTLSRIFAIDSKDNGIYEINPVDNQVLDNKSLLDEDEGPFLLPTYPTHAALASLPNGISRLFITGIDNSNASNRVIVLDYDESGGLRTAGFSPIIVSGASEDVIADLAMDTVRGLLFVSNATGGTVHAYDVATGAEVVDSPVVIPGVPGRLSFDPALQKITVVDASSNFVYWIDPAALAAEPLAFDTGVSPRDAATATNNQGSILFVSANSQNAARVFKLNFNDLPSSILLSELLPPPADQAFSVDSLISGSLNQVAAGELSDGRIAGFFTQSSGDFLIVHMGEDLNSVTPIAVKPGAVSGEDLDFFRNANGQVTTVYYASPPVGTLTLIDPLNDAFLGQIN